MQANTRILTLAVAAGMVAMAMPATALAPVGNYSLTFDFVVAVDTDWKEGVGVFEPGGPGNPCPGQRLLGARVLQPLSLYYQTGRVATNLKGPGFHVDGITPIALEPCPLPLVPPQEDIEIWFSGLNARVLYDAMSSDLNLCSQLIQSTDGGCIPSPETVTLWVADCPWAGAVFGHDNTDGKPDFGVWDVLGGALSGTIWSDSIACTTYRHSHDYTAAVTDFGTNFAATGFDLIQNANIVHSGGGDAYAVICWELDYLNIDGIDANGDGDTTDIGDTPANTVATASAHDWQLILDIDSNPAAHVPALLNHFSPLGPNFLQGLYSTAPAPSAGNGFGGCPMPGPDHDNDKELFPLPEIITPPPAGEKGREPVACVIVVTGLAGAVGQCVGGAIAACGPSGVNQFTCTVAGACDGRRVQALASIVTGTPIPDSDSLTTDVLCGGAVVTDLVTGAAASATATAPLSFAASGKITKPNDSTDYECKVSWTPGAIGIGLCLDP